MAWIPGLKTIVSGVGFLSDAYDLFIIDVVKNVMASLYPQTSAQAGAVSTAALVGAVVGQLTFGFLADQLGRRTVFILTLSLVLFGSLGLTTCMAGGPVDVYTQLALWRFLLFVGVGGEYPLAATVSAEGAQASRRGHAIALVFAMQGVGKILAAGVNYLCLASGMPSDAAWRVALGLGALPGILTWRLRWQMEESHIYKRVKSEQGVAGALTDTTESSGSLASAAEVKDGTTTGVEGQDEVTDPLGPPQLGPRSIIVDSNVKDWAGARPQSKGEDSDRLTSTSSSTGPHSAVAAGTSSSSQRFLGLDQAGMRSTLSVMWKHRWTLLGTAGNWFLLDITFYGQGLFSATVLSIAGVAGGHGSAGSGHTPSELAELARGSLMLVGIALPGYLFASALIERMGRRPMQLMGFLASAVVFFVLGSQLIKLRTDLPWLFTLLYGLTYFVANFGPNTTTFVIPAEAFPTRARATCHGVSAAVGKLGAVLGSSGMPPLWDTTVTPLELKIKAWRWSCTSVPGCRYLALA